MDQVLTAFLSGRKMTVNNTRTDGKSIFLFDNEIIKKDENNDYWINDCGWATTTTQERLNCFLREVFDSGYVSRHQGTSYLIIKERNENGSKEHRQEIKEEINISKLMREFERVIEN